jgi:hypothetical protein
VIARAFHPARLLRTLWGTGVLSDYCRLRGIPFAAAGRWREGTPARWDAAVALLPPELRAQVELDLAQVHELSGRDGNAHLEEAAGDGEVAPADVPGGAPLALWYFVRHPDLFQTVFFHHEARDARAWRMARAPSGLAVEDLPARARALAAGLRPFFGRGGGEGPFAAVEAHRIPGSVCFAAYVADRVRLVDGFTAAGNRTLQRLRPSRTVLFAYAPADGAVLLRSPLRSADRVRDLYGCFGREVLGCAVVPGGPVFDLDRLTRPFRPLPDAPDMHSIRVKALHLRYPERSGRRCVKLETLTGDTPTAVEELLRVHGGEAAAGLSVTYAEIEVRLLVAGRAKACLVRLWPDRCSLDRSPLGERLRACLRRWGLARA